jgi:indolepyruvate ferredoxin oxidoreductase beta subunit
MLDKTQPFAARSVAPNEGDVIKLAILAVGGQGGGVLSDWIVEVAEKNGYVAQSTSVAGVAQRTGATIYYVEMAPDTGRLPVFALSPSQGDVDILIAAELMEAGRAIMRGFVTPERTTLIASSHRIAAVSEKIEPGDGRASSPKVVEAAEAASKRFVAFDMERIAAENGTMISASLLGALAGSGGLPFPRESYQDAIKASGRGASASLAAFGVAYERARGLIANVAPPLIALPGTSPRQDGEKDAASAISPIANDAKKARTSPTAVFSPSLRGEDAGRQMRGGADLPGPPAAGPQRLIDRWQALAARVASLPEPVQDMALRGLRKVVDYQDVAYGREYLDMLDRAVALDGPERQYALSIAAAKHLANALCYDDMIRVADLKTRSARDRRVRREVGMKDDSILQVTEFFHPRVEEFCGTLPARLGHYIEDRPKLAAWLDRRINRGRRIRTDSMVGFGMLWVIGGLRRWRRRLLRHEVEAAHLDRWYRLALDHVADDYALAVEILNCRRLIKGYSDTHVRAQSKFDRVLSALPVLRGRPDAADWLRRLREAALKDEKGDMLDGALKTIRTL